MNAEEEVRGCLAIGLDFSFLLLFRFHAPSDTEYGVNDEQENE